MGEGLDADAVEGALACGEAKLVGGLGDVAPFEKPGVVGEFFKFAFGRFCRGEVDGEPVGFEGVLVVTLDPLLKPGGECFLGFSDFCSG